MLTDFSLSKYFKENRIGQVRVGRLLAFLGLAVLAILLAACGGVESGTASGPGQGSTLGESTAPEHSGPFSAVATSAISVDLAWEPVDGASGYRIENQFADSEWFQLAELDANQTTYEDFLTPSNMELNYRLTPLMGEQAGKALDVSVTTPEEVPNPLTVVAIREEPDYSSIGIALPGFDPSTFDPSTFDPSTLDLSGFDSENFDLSDLSPEPVSAVARIGPEGGSVSVTGKNGVIYTLDIPPDAIDFSTDFVLTPIADIQGYPFSGGYLGAVDLQPQGIIFDTPVTVTFEFPEELIASQPQDPDIVQVAFAYEREGEEFHLTPFAPEETTVSGAVSEGRKMASPAIKSNWKMIVIKQSSTPTVIGNGKPEELESHAATQAPSNPSYSAAQITAINQLADELIRFDEKREAEKRERVVRRATEIYEGLKKASDITFYSAWMLELQEFYYSSDYKRLSDEERNALMDRAANYLKLWLKPVECPSSEAGLMLAWSRRLRYAVSDFNKELKKHFVAQDPLAAEELLKSIEAVKGCTVRLRLESTLTTGTADGSCLYKIVVSAIVPLSWKIGEDGQAFLQGGAPRGESNLVYTQPVEMLSKHSNSGWCSKVVFNTLDKTVFTVTRLFPMFKSNGSFFVPADWRLAAYQIAGKVTGMSLTMSYPPPEGDSTGPGKLPKGESGDMWGGVMAIIRTQGVESPSTLGYDHWKLAASDGISYLAKWEGIGDFTDMANYHHHVTKLWIEPQ